MLASHLGSCSKTRKKKENTLTTHIQSETFKYACLAFRHTAMKISAYCMNVIDFKTCQYMTLFPIHKRNWSNFHFRLFLVLSAIKFKWFRTRIHLTLGFPFPIFYLFICRCSVETDREIQGKFNIKWKYFAHLFRRRVVEKWQKYLHIKCYIALWFCKIA